MKVYCEDIDIAASRSLANRCAHLKLDIESERNITACFGIVSTIAVLQLKGLTDL